MSTSTDILRAALNNMYCVWTSKPHMIRAHLPAGVTYAFIDNGVWHDDCLDPEWVDRSWQFTFNGVALVISNYGDDYYWVGVNSGSDQSPAHRCEDARALFSKWVDIVLMEDPEAVRAAVRDF